jgi:hypothetical protein
MIRAEGPNFKGGGEFSWKRLSGRTRFAIEKLKK